MMRSGCHHETFHSATSCQNPGSKTNSGDSIKAKKLLTARVSRLSMGAMYFSFVPNGIGRHTIDSYRVNSTGRFGIQSCIPRGFMKNFTILGCLVLLAAAAFAMPLGT